MHCALFIGLLKQSCKNIIKLWNKMTLQNNVTLMIFFDKNSFGCNAKMANVYRTTIMRPIYVIAFGIGSILNSL